VTVPPVIVVVIAARTYWNGKFARFAANAELAAFVVQVAVVENQFTLSFDPCNVTTPALTPALETTNRLCCAFANVLSSTFGVAVVADWALRDW
jgi:hypothetical protein